MIVSENIYNNILHLKFWDNFKFNNTIRRAILFIIEDFLSDDDHIKFKNIYDVRLSGSLANYNYSDKSDIDVHILLDYKKINRDEGLVKRLLDYKRHLWNGKHNIVILDHQLELYFQDKDEIHISAGVFSLLKDKWIKKPKLREFSLDKTSINDKFDNIKLKINNLVCLMSNSNSPKKLKRYNKKAIKLKDVILNMRRRGLKDSGEMSEDNLVFKKLRDKGYIKKLNDSIIMSYDDVFNIYFKNKSL